MKFCKKVVSSFYRFSLKIEILYAFQAVGVSVTVIVTATLCSVLGAGIFGGVGYFFWKKGTSQESSYTSGSSSENRCKTENTNISMATLPPEVCQTKKHDDANSKTMNAELDEKISHADHSTNNPRVLVKLDNISEFEV